MGGFSQITGDPLGSVMNANNVSFDGTERGGVVTLDGQLLIGATATPHIRVGTLTAGSGVIITNGAGTITIAAMASVAVTYTEDTGTAVPAANNLNVLGSGSITTSGAGSTITTALTGLTNHAVLVGAGTSTITKIAATANTGAILQNNSGADPSYSTATYPSTTTINQILYSSAANTVTGLATANRGVLTTGATGVPVITALATDGQLIIGSTAGAPAASTLTAGTGVSITNASNSITVNVVGGGITWSVVTVDTSFTVNTGTVANKSGLLTMTLPASAAVGDIIAITGINTATGWKIAQNANQQIFFGNTSTTLGATGSLASAAIRDTVKLVCVVAGASTVYNVINSVGNITVV